MHKNSPMAKFPVIVPRGLHTKFKMLCASEGRLMSEVVRELLEAKVNAVRRAEREAASAPEEATQPAPPAKPTTPRRPRTAKLEGANV